MNSPKTRKILSRSLKLIVLVVICSLFASACSSRRDKGDGFREKMMVRYISFKLDFNDEQEEKLSVIRNEIKIIREETLAQRDADKAEMLTLIQAEQLDTERLQQLLDQQLNSIQDNSPRLFPLLADLHMTLDSEQREDLVAMMSKK
jgi:Spy/CpxP family protein refolding chaperone